MTEQRCLFIARYRKEATAGLNDTQLRQLSERLYYLRELEERRAVILQTIREQEKLTPDLERAILTADTKNRLEDLYLPFPPNVVLKHILQKKLLRTFGRGSVERSYPAT